MEPPIKEVINIKRVNATRGKAVRAEPISGLGQQGRIHHVGSFPVLEDQLCSFESGDANDRVDAYVWAFTDLLQKGAMVHTY
jgi:phage terminase large subunit-like protein